MENIPCDTIEMKSWNALPISIRVKDFCNHCEFKCEHGRECITYIKSLPQCNKKKQRERENINNII